MRIVCWLFCVCLSSQCFYPDTSEATITFSCLAVSTETLKLIDTDRLQIKGKNYV